MNGRRGRAALILLALTAGIPSLPAQAPITIVVVDPPGVGLNDPTPAEPVGGNKGTTVGEQRLEAFRYAAGVWSSKLQPVVPIRIRSGFKSLPCTERSGILGVTSVDHVFASKGGDPQFIPNVWYPAALANQLAERVLDPDMEEIETLLNSDMGKPGCLTNQTWYYGLENRASSTQADIVATLLHEFAHGLGFGPHPHMDDFSKFRGKGDVYHQYVLDTTTGKTWNEMTDEERAVSATNTKRVVWNGINVRNAVPKVLLPGTPTFRVAEPKEIAGDYAVGLATFGKPLGTIGTAGALAGALDEANPEGPSTTDGCSPLLNAGEIAGRIAVADRGTCSFVQKARNAQDAGAIGLVIVNNVAGSFAINPNGTDPAIQIPVVHVTQNTGKALKAALAASQTMTAEMVADAGLRAGADREDRPLIFNPDPVADGSTISHWDPSAFPNQVMEPDVTDAAQSVEPPFDLTLSLLQDLGWFSDFDGVPDGVDQCPGSDRGATLVIQGCDTGVPNTTFATGCRISDYLKVCKDRVRNTGGFASCVNTVGRQMLGWGAIGPEDPGKIQACTARPVHR